MSEYVSRDHFQEFTDKIVTSLESGTKPWVRPWDPAKAGGPQAPINAATGDHYHGINVLVLGMDMRAVTTADPRWCTYQQARQEDWQVRKGEKATTIFFYKPLEIDDEKADNGKRTIPMLRTFSVFHASQIDGIPAHRPPTLEEAPWTRPEAVSVILSNSLATIRIGGDRAFYSPTRDHIQLPPERAFNRQEDWATTALHELGHWTGHPTRLNRDLTGRFGSGSYAQEELRAELASAFVAAELGLPSDIPQHADYMASWIKALKNDKREIFHAAADARKISEMQLGFHPDFAARMANELQSRQDREARPAAAEIGARTNRDARRPRVA